jgi:hypothetical protein
VLLAQFTLSASLWTAARSTGNFSEGELITEPRPKTSLGWMPWITRLTTAIVLLNGSLTNSCERRARVWIHENTEPGLDAMAWPLVIFKTRASDMKRRIPAPPEEGLNRACRRETIEPLEGVLLHDGAVGGDDGKHRFAGTVRRRAEEGRPHRARAQRARDDLRLRRHGDDVAVCKAIDVDPPITGLGAPARGSPVGSRIEDDPTPFSPNGAFAGQIRPNALLFERPRGLLTPVYEAVFAPGLLTPLYQ